MVQDTRKALDDKTKKLAGGKIEDGKEHAAYQESQQQLLAIQAEQQQNLAVARAESKASFENNQTLAQAAELGAISAAEAEQAAALGAQAGAQLNPATQQILSKYGAGQPKFSRSQSHSQQVTKQNITINNNITSNTTNDVKVPANIGGPLQGRPLQFKDPATSGGSVGKFKSWISSAFARQNEEGAKRDREYRNRESSLTRSANKMMKRLEEVGKTIGSRMDPRKIGSTWQSQLKTLLLLFGFGYLTSNWTKILTHIADIEKWFKEDFAHFLGIGLGEGKESGLKKMLRGLLGGQEGESLSESFGKLLFVGDESLLGYMKLWLKNAMEERSKAIKLIKFPQLNMDDVVGSIGKIGEYLGDIMSALVSGAEGAKRHISTQLGFAANRGALQFMQNDDNTRDSAEVTYEGKKVKADKGLEALFKNDKGIREHRGLTRYSLDSSGELVGSAESTFAQSVQLESDYIDAIKGKRAFNTADVARGLERLYNAAKRKKESEGHGIPIAEGFLDLLSSDFAEKLTKEGKLKKVPYHRVVRKKTDEDYAIEEADPTAMATKAFANKAILDAVGLGGVSDTIAQVEGAAAGAAGGAAGGALVDGIGAVPGALLGGSLGWLAGGALNSKWARGAGAGIKGLYNKWTSNDYRIEYKRGKGSSDEDTIYMQEITPEGIQEVANFLTNGLSTDTQTQANINITDRTFTDNIRKSFEIAAKNNIENLKRQHREAQKKVRRTLSWEDTQDARKKERAVYDAEQAMKGVDDSDLQELYRGIEELSDIEAEHRQQENQAWNNLRIVRGAEYAGLDLSRYETKNLTNLQKKRAEYAINQFMKEGLTREQAAGIVGNMIKESSLNPKSGNWDSNGKWAGGIVSWNGENYERVKNYFGRDLKDVSFEDQLKYLIKEMKGEVSGITAVERNNYLKNHGFKTGANVMEVMKRTTGIEDATNTFERVFEGSGDYKKEKNKTRLDFAATVYGGTQGTTGGYTGPINNVAKSAVEASRSGTLDSKKLGNNYKLGRDSYQGACTSGPATWYRRAGIELDGHWWNDDVSKATKTNITDVGFNEVWSGSADDVKQNRMANVLQPGDIMVEFGYHGRDGSPSSHAQMWDGSHWMSDTIQSNPWVYGKGGRLGNRSEVREEMKKPLLNVKKTEQDPS